MKRALLVSLSLALLLSLTACGDSPDPAKSPPAQPAASTPASHQRA